MKRIITTLSTEIAEMKRIITTLSIEIAEMKKKNKNLVHLIIK